MEGLLNQLVLGHLQLAPLLWGEYPSSPPRTCTTPASGSRLSCARRGVLSHSLGMGVEVPSASSRGQCRMGVASADVCASRVGGGGRGQGVDQLRSRSPGPCQELVCKAPSLSWCSAPESPWVALPMGYWRHCCLSHVDLSPQSEPYGQQWKHFVEKQSNYSPRVKVKVFLMLRN